jgi:hypothetical protein
MLDQFNHSSALLKPVRRVQFGVFSPDDIVRAGVGAGSQGEWGMGWGRRDAPGLYGAPASAHGHARSPIRHARRPLP